MKKVLFLKNAAVLTVTSLILRTIGIFFRVWITGQIGAEGIGLYQVVFSVYVLASTFATSGICTAVTRIITERLAEGDKKGVEKTLKTSVLLCLLIAFVTILTIFLFSGPISKYLIKDERAEISLKILCLSLPFIGVCSVIRGYFLARRKSLQPSFAQIFEQLLRILVIVFLVGKVAPYGIAWTSAAVMAGDSVSEMVGAAFLYLSYLADKKHIKHEKDSGGGIFKEILRIATPISAGRYLHTALRTAENLLTPICLSKYKKTSMGGLEQFGMVKGMAIPLLLFPASILSSISTLLVTEITESLQKGNKKGVSLSSEKVIYITSIFSFLISGIFFSGANQIGNLVYGSKEVGYLIRALSPLVPFMYLDLICDGILKGLDGQKMLFKTSVTDSAVRVILVLLLVPRFGMSGFLGVMLFSNVYTAVAAVVKIVKVTKMKISIKKLFLKPLFSVFASVVITGKLLSPTASNLVYILTAAASITTLYFLFMFFLGGIKLNQNFLKK